VIKEIKYWNILKITLAHARMDWLRNRVWDQDREAWMKKKKFLVRVS
jgi:hypothetical protein